LHIVSTAEDWQVVQMIRTEVFIEEQSCPPEEEWDRWDAISTHYLLRSDGMPVGTARTYRTVRGGEIALVLGRIAILKQYRGQGFATQMVGTILGWYPHETVHIDAQAHLHDWYAHWGFVRSGPNFVEVGIDHVPMLRKKRP
jgi:predicted GNAT family N-acyltransferase